MDWRVPLADLDYGVEEEDAVRAVLRSRWLTMGEVTHAFENEYARATGAKYAFAVSNATAALHLACLALGLGPGDEVIAPSLTFVATTNAVLYTGADVRFADIIGPRDLTIAPADAEKHITPRTRAVVVMHYGGYPCHMEQIVDIASRHRLAVIEDACHAPGGRLNGRALGTWGDVGCFSFFSNKNLAAGEGGMLLTDRDDVAEKVRLLRSHGMTTLTWERHRGHAHSYDVTDLGYNYRLDEIRSALGRVQLLKLARNNARRREITQIYRTRLDRSGLDLPFRDSAGEPSYHLFPVLLPAGTDRDRFMDAMRSEGVQTSIHYPPVHRFSYYASRYPENALPNTESVAAREVTLPLYPTMRSDQIELVVQAVCRSLEAVGPPA